MQTFVVSGKQQICRSCIRVRAKVSVKCLKPGLGVKLGNGKANKLWLNYIYYNY